MDDLTLLGQKCVNGAVRLYFLRKNRLEFYAEFPPDASNKPDYRSSKVTVNCAIWPLVWLPKEPKRVVKIEVSGGVAECTSAPDDIDVEIIDHDNIKAEEAMTPAERKRWNHGK